MIVYDLFLKLPRGNLYNKMHEDWEWTYRERMRLLPLYFYWSPYFYQSSNYVGVHYRKLWRDCF